MVIADKMSRGRTLIIGGGMADEIGMDMLKQGIKQESEIMDISDNTIIKYLNHPKNAKGAGIKPSEWGKVSKVLYNPKGIYQDTKQKYLTYVKTAPYDKDRTIKVVIRPNYKQVGSTSNRIVSVGIVPNRDMKNKQYRKIK